MKKSKIILLVAGVLLLALGVCLFAFAPAQNTYLKSAVFLKEPVVESYIYSPELVPTQMFPS